MERPNFVIVVLDCVRAWDFPGGLDGVAGMPNVERLMEEAITFPRAVAPAPWTQPSHASLFTGLYPWDHGLHGRRSLALGDSVPRLPGLLSQYGYRTASFSANPLICPLTGLASGFELAEWGNMSDMFLRLYHGTLAPHRHPTDGSESGPGRTSPFGRLLSRLPYDELPFRSLLERNLIVPAVLNRALEGLRGCPEDDTFTPARWIEPEFESFLSSVPPDEPVLSFVNLLDAHEPYFPYPGALREQGGTWAYLRLRQDRLGWLNSEARRASGDAQLLHTLYRESVRRLDRRIGNLIDLLRRSGRWENTCLILTSDHGQAFGERGMLFHRFRVDESLVRIPLVARFPNGSRSGRRAPGWASLVDIVPTVFDQMGISCPTRVSGVSLERLIDGDARDAVYSVTDGTIGERWIPADRRAELDRLGIAAYHDDLKVIVSSDPAEFRAYDIAKDPRESSDVWDSDRVELVRTGEEAARTLAKLTHGPRESTTEAVSDRLKAWGYI